MTFSPMPKRRPAPEYGAMFAIFGFFDYAGRFLRHTGPNLHLYFALLRLLIDAHGGTPGNALEPLPSYLLHDSDQAADASSQLRSFLEVYFRRKAIPWFGTSTNYWLGAFSDEIADFFNRVSVIYYSSSSNMPGL